MRSKSEKNKKLETAFAHIVFVSLLVGGAVVMVYRVMQGLEVTFRRDVAPLLILGCVYPMVVYGIKYQGTEIGSGAVKNTQCNKNRAFPKDERKS